MGWFRKIAIALFLLVAVTIAGVLWFLNAHGRSLFIERVSSLTQRKVSVASIRPVLPMGLELHEMRINGLLTVEHARVDVDPWALLRGELTFSGASVHGAVLLLEREGDASLNALAAPSDPSSGDTRPQAPAPVALSKARPLILRKLTIRDSVFHVYDKKNKRDWIVENIDGHLEGVPLSSDPVKTEVFLTGSLARMNMPFVGHLVKVKGWLNWVQRDMNVSVQAIDDDGRLGLDVVLGAQANDLQVKGNARMTGSQMKQADGKKSGVLEGAVLGILDALSTDINVRFSFHTRMDHFEVGKISLAGEIGTPGLQQGPSSGNIVEGLRAVGEEILKQQEPEAGQQEVNGQKAPDK